MTKQQAISLHLAKWLGWDARISESGCGYYVCIDARKEFVPFRPFSATTEGRAQFAECVIKADMCGIDTGVFGPPSTPDDYVEKRLEIIYEDTGGTAGEWEES